VKDKRSKGDEFLDITTYCLFSWFI